MLYRPHLLDKGKKMMMMEVLCGVRAEQKEAPSIHECRKRRLKDYQHSHLRRTAIRQWAYDLRSAVSAIAEAQ
jgi:hypothetical protein